MFGLFKKKGQGAEPGNYAGRKFSSFVLAIPEDWHCTDDNGTLRAHKNDEIRLNVSLRDMTQVPDYSLDDVFTTVKKGYFNSDINWAVYSEKFQKEGLIYQTLEYGDDPRLVIAVAEKSVKGKKLVLIISFSGNSGKEIETHFKTFTDIVENIEEI